MVAGAARSDGFLSRTGPGLSAIRASGPALMVATGCLLVDHVPEAAFLALAVAVGLPHGALDYVTGQHVFCPKYGRRWWRPFLAGYGMLISATLLLWWILPGAALLLFLGLSLFHFGDEDAPVQADAHARIVRVIAHGGSIIIVPAVCHPLVVEHLFALLTPTWAHTIRMLLGGPSMVVWAVAAARTTITYVRQGNGQNAAAAIDLVLVTMLFALANPLIAFSLYFAAIHTPRALAVALPTHRRTARALVIPITLALLALGLGAVIFIVGAGRTIEADLVRSTFILLSALTVPHMWLKWRVRQSHHKRSNAKIAQDGQYRRGSWTNCHISRTQDAGDRLPAYRAAPDGMVSDTPQNRRACLRAAMDERARRRFDEDQPVC